MTSLQKWKNTFSSKLPATMCQRETFHCLKIRTHQVTRWRKRFPSTGFWEECTFSKLAKSACFHLLKGSLIILIKVLVNVFLNLINMLKSTKAPHIESSTWNHKSIALTKDKDEKQTCLHKLIPRFLYCKQLCASQSERKPWEISIIPKCWRITATNDN